MDNNVLIYDIETRVYGRPDSEKDLLKIFGCYSYKTNKTYLLTDKEQIQKIISAHKFLVGFNNEMYDDPILKREGIKLDYKIIIDLRKILKMRAIAMQIKEGMLGDLIMSYSLDFITKLLGLANEEDGKIKIDYKLFEKDFWTEEELKEISIYAERDIIVTKKLYEWIENYFENFKPFLKEEDVNKKVYLTASIAKVAYKAICKAMNWNEEYGIMTGEEDSISGGYVSYPAGERFEGDIFCLDFRSLYPHIMIQCNIFGRHSGDIYKRPIWNGNNVWKIDGEYYSDKLSGVGELLFNWYNDRVTYKKLKDNKEYTLKIILNTIYGIMNHPYYIKVYDLIAGGDCTRIGRQWIKYARKTFKENGYEVIYTDTDSIFFVDTYKDKTKMLQTKDKIISYIKNTIPFPKETFDMGIDAEIKYMFFFKGGTKENKTTDIEMDEDDFINKPKGFIKKNYIYVQKDNTVRIKNLGIRKKSNTPLSRKIFNEYLVPQIKEGKIKFGKTYLYNLIFELLNKDISLACMRKEVDDFNVYKLKSPNSIQAQIALKYGSGIHFLIPNTKGIGVGKGKSFCTLEEFKQHKMGIEHIDLTNIWSELEYFIKPAITKNIFDYKDEEG